MKDPNGTLSRRNMILGASLLGLSACATSETSGSQPLATPNNSAQNSPLEAANETLVNDFCRDWSLGDTSKLVPYFSEDIVYQIVEGTPLVNGKQEFIERVQPFLDNFKSIRWETLRSSAMGRIVLNDRIDYYEDPVKGEPQIFKVIGVFRVEENKIVEWRDWSVPA